MMLIDSLEADPLARLKLWLKEAETRGLKDWNAMALATASTDGRPSVRIVLCKAVDTEGLQFFTNYDSRKAAELGGNPYAAVVFHWPEFGRQVRLEGRVERTNRATSEAYFDTRPRGSQLGAWASPQSRKLGSFKELTTAYDAADKRYEGRPVPCPPHWGGFRLTAESCEYWISAESRLHDRVLYQRGPRGWEKSQIAP